MKNLKIDKGQLKSTIKLPASKSYANRILILASVNPEPFIIENLPSSTDVSHLVAALEVIGLKMKKVDSTLIVENSFPACEREGKTVEVGEGGTTARFLAALLCLGSRPYKLILGERLKERPWDEFIQLVNRYGGRASLSDGELDIQGPLHFPAEIKIDCSRTSQFASGLMLAFAGQGVKVIPENLQTSQSYWEMTEELVRLSQAMPCFKTPLDWSSASYPMAFGALNQSIFFPGLQFDKFQADAKFLNLLKDFGAIFERSDGLEVRPIQTHHSITHDVSDCLDLVPTLGYLLAHIEGEHVLLNIQNLVHKESDRLTEVVKLVNSFGRVARVEGHSLMISGKKGISDEAKNLHMPFDHRMVMAGALFLLHHAGGTIAPAEAVDKSYPNFFEIIKKI